MTSYKSLAAVSLMLLAGGVPATAFAQGATAMEQVEMANPSPGATGTPALAKPEEVSPFVRDSKFGGQFRTFYFNREKYDNTHSEAWAIGGSLAYLSGYVGNLVRLGAVGYTSQPLYAPDNRDGTLLLKPGQEGYTVLGQIYGEFKLSDSIFAAVGRKEYNTPYINNHDVRMTPNTFEGVTAYGKAGGPDGAWRFGGGYISKIKEKNSDEFVSMSQDAGAAVERGVTMAGANFGGKDFSLGAINYYSKDIINIFYTEGSFSPGLADGSKLKLSAQLSDQRNTGDNLLTGAPFSTRQWGLKGDLGMGAAVMTLGFTSVADGADVINPWSGHPGYGSSQVKDFNRAGEKALLLKGAYDFTSRGVPGFSAYALWVHGSDVKAPAFNEDEYDFNLQWAPKSGSLKGASFRVRYAYVGQRGGGDPAINDFRIIVNYDF